MKKESNRFKRSACVYESTSYSMDLHESFINYVSFNIEMKMTRRSLKRGSVDINH